jgi:hypothetical protein
MKHITKITLVILTSFAFTLSAFAGDLQVTGAAKASYKIGGADKNNSKGLGVSNELDFSATGELDNGYTWSWQTQLDDAGTVNDDTKLTVTTPMGMVGMYITEGGMSKELGYGIGAMGPGSDWAGPMTIVWGYDVSSFNNVQYSLPAGMLPYGIGATIGYVPNLSDAQGASFKAEGSVETNAVGSDAIMYNLTAAPVDGLSIGAAYFNASPTTGSRYDQESGDVFFKYSMGPFSVGAAKSAAVPYVAKGSETTFYETDSYGVQFAVNDQLSLSYSKEASEKSTRTAVASAATVGTKASVESKITHIQAAYTIGGATLGFAVADASDSDYTAGVDEKVSTFTVAMAF